MLDKEFLPKLSGERIGKYRLVSATLQDVDTLVSLRKEAADWLTETFGEEAGGQWQEGLTDEQVRERYRNGIRLGETYLLKDGQNTIATMKVSPKGDPKLWPPEELIQPALYVSQLIVLRAKHGEGIGASVLNWVSDQAEKRGAGYIRVDIWDTNYKLQQWYEKQGFEGVRSIPFPNYLASTLMQRPTETTQKERVYFEKINKDFTYPTLDNLCQDRELVSTIPHLSDENIARWQAGNYSGIYLCPDFSLGFLQSHYKERNNSRVMKHVGHENLRMLLSEIGPAQVFIRVDTRSKEELVIGLEHPSIDWNTYKRRCEAYRMGGYQGRGVLVKGSVDEKGNIVLADGGIVTLSECIVDSFRPPTEEEFGIQTCELHEQDKVMARLTVPPVAPGFLSSVHAKVVRLRKANTNV